MARARRRAERPTFLAAFTAQTLDKLLLHQRGTMGDRRERRRAHAAVSGTEVEGLRRRISHQPAPAKLVPRGWPHCPRVAPMRSTSESGETMVQACVAWAVRGGWEKGGSCTGRKKREGRDEPLASLDPGPSLSSAFVLSPAPIQQTTRARLPHALTRAHRRACLNKILHNMNTWHYRLGVVLKEWPCLSPPQPRPTPFRSFPFAFMPRTTDPAAPPETQGWARPHPS